MKALYIGILTDGTTSKMRADNLSGLLPATEWTLVDTDEVFRLAPRIWKTMAFRLKSGPLVNRINRQVIERAGESKYDLIWVDKGVYLWQSTVNHLRQKTDCLVHFTPDTAFYANQSRHFLASASQFDLLVTTKSFELDKYSEIVDREHVFLTTQAYDAGLHRPQDSSPIKKKAAVFIGLCESDREACVTALLKEGVPVRLGGRGWEKFLAQHADAPGLFFLGREMFGNEYIAEYSGAYAGLGLLSKRFPELHTTRTFEIPACGAMLATERNTETTQFFDEDEVLFFDSYDELALNLKNMFENPEMMKETAKKGCQRVLADCREYASVLSKVLTQVERV